MNNSENYNGISNNISGSNNYSSSVNENNKKFKKMIFVIVAIIGIALLAFFVYKKFFDKTSEEFDINYSTSFFLLDNNNKYALFDDDGNRLTEFIFDKVSNFVNGTATVTKADQVGIISDSGKMTVDFGKYTFISAKGGLYEVHGGDYHYYLIDSNGKVLYDLESAHLKTFIGSNLYSILDDEKSNTYQVLNYNGKKMADFPKIEDSLDPATSEEEGYLSVYYNG